MPIPDRIFEIEQIDIDILTLLALVTIGMATFTTKLHVRCKGLQGSR